jgi:Flp pilus assembly pilin Flp
VNLQALAFGQTTKSGPKGGEMSVELRSVLAAVTSYLRQRDRGQGLAEYALILGLIAIVSIVALIFMGSQVSDKLSVIGSTIESVRVNH